MRATALLLCCLITCAGVACACGPMSGHSTEHEPGHTAAAVAHEMPLHGGHNHATIDVDDTDPGSIHAHKHNETTAPCAYDECAGCGANSFLSVRTAPDPISPDPPAAPTASVLVLLSSGVVSSNPYWPPWQGGTSRIHTPISRHDLLLM